MKKNFYYMSLLLGLVFGTAMFTACGGGDDDISGNSSGQNAGGDSAVEDYGTDGLKGFWVKNVWDETVLEEWYFYLSKEEKIVGQVNDLIYFDGDGGGTIYFSVTTLDHAANYTKYLAGKVGTFFDSADGMTKDYYFSKRYFHSDGSITVNGRTEDVSEGKSFPIEYYIKGTTMTIYYNNVTQSIQLNVSSGNVSGYHRLKKVD